MGGGMTRFGSLETDVVVVGAGPSGVPAALAAARCGAKVILLEEDALPGGAPVDMYVSMICGGPRRGIYSEIINYLNENHTLDRQPIIPFNNGEDGCNHWYLPYAYADAVMHFINQEPNITLMTNARVVGLITETAGVPADSSEGRTTVAGVLVEGSPGTQPLEIRAKVTIDATGTGILGELAGCDVRYGADTKADFGEEWAPDEKDNIVMPCTLMYITQRLQPGPMPSKEELTRGGFVEDKLNRWASSAYDEALKNNKGIYLHWGATVSCEDTRDPIALGKAHIQALEMIKHNARVWYNHGFNVHIAPKIGVRECRRVIGEYVLTIYDMLDGRYHHDTIAFSSYGLDTWGSTKVGDKELNKLVKPYGIPYRALVPKGTEGLLMAGKSISGSRFVCSSYRVQPIVAQIGEAAGAAAAQAVKANQKLRDVNVTKLQSILNIDESQMPRR